jgi:hypothetical protein
MINIVKLYNKNNYIKYQTLRNICNYKQIVIVVVMAV